MAELVATTEPQLSITENSSVAEKQIAIKQYQAASAEWNAWLQANEGALPYRPAAEAKLSEILQKYPYVGVTSNSGMLVKDNLGINQNIAGQQGTLPPQQFPQLLKGRPDAANNGVPNTDDAYPLTKPDPADLNQAPVTTSPTAPGTNPTDPARLNATTGSTTVGSTASDAPGLAGKGTTPTTGQRSGPPSEYEATANTTPVTQTGDIASSTSTTGRSGPPSEYETSSDDSGSSGGTGTEAGGKTDESGTGRRESNGSVTVGQQGRKGPPDEYEASAGGTPPNKVMILRPNKLHEYVNWTYQVGWYMLDIATYNRFTDSGQDSQALRKYPLLRSGGFAKTGSGLTYDLGLNSLRFTTVIASSNMSPNASIGEIDMQVVEPYGVSLLADMKRIANGLPNGPHDHFQIPYLIEIKYVGYDDSGRLIPNIPGTGPKLIPCQIINITFNITSAGTVYDIKLVPYSQQGINKFYGVLREDTRLYGKTFEDFLKGPEGLATKLKKAGEADKQNGRAEYPDEYDFEIVSFDKNRTADDGKLRQSEMTFDIKEGGAITAVSARRMGPPDEYQAGNDPMKSYYQLKAGSNIKDLIRDIAITSKYYQSKITDGEIDKNNPMELIKVVPVVKDLGKFDTKRGVYQKKIIYKVMPYYVYGKNNPKTGQAPVEKRGHVKEYNWLFTGKNDDILNIDLNFNVMYFKIFEGKSDQRALLESGAQVPNTPQYQSSSGQDPKQTALTYKQTTGSTTRAMAKGYKPDAVAEYFDQELNSPDLADLVKIDVDIIGDPDFVAQDRSVRPVGTDIDAANNGYVDGDVNKGVSVDVDGVYVKLNFRTPRDYDENSGLMMLSPGQELIGGMYQVITVESVFEGGKFTQKLNMVRVFDQPENKVDKQVAPTQREAVAPGAGRSGFSTVTNKPSGTPVDKSPGAGRSGFSTMPTSLPGDAAYGDDAMAPIDATDKAVRDYYLGRN